MKPSKKRFRASSLDMDTDAEDSMRCQRMYHVWLDRTTLHATKGKQAGSDMGNSRSKDGMCNKKSRMSVNVIRRLSCHVLSPWRDERRILIVGEFEPQSKHDEHNTHRIKTSGDSQISRHRSEEVYNFGASVSWVASGSRIIEDDSDVLAICLLLGLSGQWNGDSKEAAMPPTVQANLRLQAGSQCTTSPEAIISHPMETGEVFGGPEMPKVYASRFEIEEYGGKLQLEGSTKSKVGHCHPVTSADLNARAPAKTSRPGTRGSWVSTHERIGSALKILQNGWISILDFWR
ncbi:hypothetical protein EDD22DRAFT_843578 [Suillus occidentalis]|nr:hypothetical protein EDD22DRAFT_843578 [Suillus occidentalis]